MSHGYGGHGGYSGHGQGGHYPPPTTHTSYGYGAPTHGTYVPPVVTQHPVQYPVYPTQTYTTGHVAQPVVHPAPTTYSHGGYAPAPTYGHGGYSHGGGYGHGGGHGYGGHH